MFPIIFQFNSITIYSFGLFSALGFIVAVFFLVATSRRSKLSLDFLSDHLWLFFVVALIGARLSFVLENWSSFQIVPFSAFYFWEGGFTLSGGIIGLILTLLFFCKKHGEKFLKWIDVVVMGGLLGLSFVDIGCLLDGCNYGKPTQLPWGIAFENIELPYAIPLHPTQIYSAIFHILIAFLLYRWWRKKPGKGKVGLLGLILSAFFNFFNDFLRGDPATLFFNFLRTDQIFYLSLFLICGILLLKYEYLIPHDTIPATKLHQKE